MLLRALLLAASALVLHALPAHAAEFCVHKIGACPEGTIDKGSSLQDALSHAAVTPGPDVVSVRSGQYTGPFDYVSAYRVEIVGSGSAATRLTAPGADAVDSVLYATNAAVSRLSVVVPDASSWSGLTLAGGARAEQVRVRRAAGAINGVIGVKLLQDATLRSSHVELAALNDVAVAASDRAWSATPPSAASTAPSSRAVRMPRPRSARAA